MEDSGWRNAHGCRECEEIQSSDTPNFYHSLLRDLKPERNRKKLKKKVSFSIVTNFNCQKLPIELFIIRCCATKSSIYVGMKFDAKFYF